MAGLSYVVASDTAAQSLLKQRVAMGSYKKATTMLAAGTPPLTAGTTQGQRNALVQQIIIDPNNHVDILTRYVTLDSTLVTPEDITDPKIDSLLTTAVIDAVAAILYPGI